MQKSVAKGTLPMRSEEKLHRRLKKMPRHMPADMFASGKIFCPGERMGLRVLSDLGKSPDRIRVASQLPYQPCPSYKLTAQVGSPDRHPIRLFHPCSARLPGCTCVPEGSIRFPRQVQACIRRNNTRAQAGQAGVMSS